MEEYENNIVTLIDADGGEVEFDHLMTFEHLGEHYVALMPMEDVDGIGEDEVVILRVVKSGGGEEFESVDNDLLLEEVFDTFLQLLEEDDDG